MTPHQALSTEWEGFCSIVLDVLRLQALEALHRHMLHKCEHLLLGIFILVALARHADTHTPGDVANTLAPHKLVELGVDPNVLCAHDLCRELADFFDRSGCTLLELDLDEVLVQMDRVIA